MGSAHIFDLGAWILVIWLWDFLEHTFSKSGKKNKVVFFAFLSSPR